MLPKHENVVCHVADHFLSCKFDSLADWCVNWYTFLMTTHIFKNEVYMTCGAFSPGS